jgi:tRNA(Arg) A34 adenosine deaminase TadA
MPVNRGFNWLFERRKFPRGQLILPFNSTSSKSYGQLVCGLIRHGISPLKAHSVFLCFRHVKNPGKEASKMKDFMAQTIALLPNINTQDLPIASLLVNPKTNQVLATAHDTRRSSHYPLHHCIMNLLASLPALPQPAKPAVEDDEQYYAHEYDVYTTHEPCTMCAMALVHSRIRRLCFWMGMKTGARELGWMTRGEGEEGLNHRFLVFEGVEGGLGGEMEEMVRELGDNVCA